MNEQEGAQEMQRCSQPSQSGSSALMQGLREADAYSLSSDWGKRRNMRPHRSPPKASLQARLKLPNSAFEETQQGLKVLA